jgi:hypothetical protein
MKIARYTTLLLLACLLAGGAQAEPRPRVTEIPPPRNVLFIGNSFTFYNNGLHNHLRYMMEAGGHEAGTIRAMTISGAYLEEHAPALPAMLESADWDVVILQGHSMEAIDRERLPAFRQAVRSFAGQISDSGATPVLFMTWARSNLPEQTAALNENYTAAGNDAGALVVPVGLAFERSTNEKNGIALRMEDLRHPTLAGSYLAACTFYAALFGESPVRHPYTAGLDLRTAWTLQRIAAETVEAYYGRQLDEAD